MRDLYDQVKRLAVRGEPVVIMGPSGSGKELVARALHDQGPRAGGPFIATNAASLPVNLAEDELFGHEKGAFTGAHDRHLGCLERADGGTLFLDEIADMDSAVQAKLLRVIETGQFLRLGGSKTVSVDARIVAATHKDLQRLAQDNVFRHDLWYRLCTFVLNVPPLHERREDIPLLAREFLDRMSGEMSTSYVFSPGAVDALSRRIYPGNIRELKHIVTRAAVFSEKSVIDEIAIERVAPCEGDPVSSESALSAPFTPYTNLDFRAARDAFERDYLSAVLARHNNNITAAAAEIGMAQSNLSRKLKDLDLK
jgi:DNA-binding NtrC family response regulator